MVELNHGDVLVCKRDSFLSGVIRKATKSEWSHTAIAIEIWGKMYIVDMQSKGIELNTLDGWIKKWNYDYIVWRYENANSSYNKIAKRAVSKVGKRTKYDYITFIFRIPWKLKTNKFTYKGEKVETKRMICSQLTGWIWSLENWWQMTPDDQNKYFRRNNSWEKII